MADTYTANKRILFGGDNYAEEWHAEAESRGLKNLRTTPDALPEVVAEPTVAAFGKYEVLSERELESRYEVWLEQYVMRANIEAETTETIARTLLLPAALRHLALIDASGVDSMAGDVKSRVEELNEAIDSLAQANLYPGRGRGSGAGRVRPGSPANAMNVVREAADKLERIVADDLWPLPKYSEILFIK